MLFINKLYPGFLFVGCLLPAVARAQQAGALPTTVTTLAGAAGRKGSTDGTGENATFAFPHSIAVDAGGTVYVADMANHTIRKITPQGSVTTLAGLAGHKGSTDGAGATARFASPAGIALGPNGVLYIADAGSHLIRTISPAGIVSTLAGAAGRKGAADGTGAEARFNSPHALAIDAAGMLYVADTYNHTIRTITPAGVVATLAGKAGRKGQADGAGLAAGFFHSAGLAVDAQGNLYVADNGSHTIRKITPGGVVSALAGQAGHHGSADGLGAHAQFDVPGSVAVDSRGGLYVTDYFNSTIRQITPQGQVSTFAGVVKGWRSVDGPRAQACFNFPFGVAVGANGWVYVADSGSRTIRVIR